MSGAKAERAIVRFMDDTGGNGHGQHQSLVAALH
jgi:hypothetical protein